MIAEEAVLALAAELLARDAVVEQLDAVLCEDGWTLMMYTYIAGDDEPIVTTFDWP